MKRLIVALCTAVMLGCAGSVLANEHRIPICHNGSTYNVDGTESSISFVITIAGRQPAKAVAKHLEKHLDSDSYIERGPGQVCELGDDGARQCTDVTLCEDDPII
ncbi:MAG: hypothetical protein OEM64_15575 [Gammaproteobacteria bacterium]|nr:hypothetical protein [Gammaproteobacteria bacterium]